MKKKGLSAIIAVVLIILMVVFAMALLWLLVSPFIETKLFSEQVSSALMGEKFSISYVGEGDNDTDLEVVINRGTTDLMELAIENVTETIWTEQVIPTDIMLLVDLSGSMRFLVDYDCLVGGVVSTDPDCTEPGYDNDSCTDDCGGSVAPDTGFYPIDILNSSAKGFVNEILSRNSATEIALLGFSSGNSGFPFLNFTNNPDALRVGINNWKADGNTHLYKGLQYAYGNFSGRTSQNKILIVLGDGDINDESVNDAITYSSNFNNSGIKVHTIGFGPNANTALYQGIADTGPGDYHDSSNLSKLSEVFANITSKTEITELVGEEVSIWGVFLDITVFANGGSFVHRIKRDLPGSNEGRKYSINLKEYSSELTVGDVTKVEIYLVAVSQGAVENSVLVARYNVD